MALEVTRSCRLTDWSLGNGNTPGPLDEEVRKTKIGFLRGERNIGGHFSEESV